MESSPELEITLDLPGDLAEFSCSTGCLEDLAEESHQSIAGLLTDAIREYVRRRRVRPDVLRHLEDSIADNEELGRLLAE